jgi:hypothetical protein
MKLNFDNNVLQNVAFYMMHVNSIEVLRHECGTRRKAVEVTELKIIADPKKFM